MADNETPEATPSPPGTPRWIDAHTLRGGERVWRIVGVRSVNFAGSEATVTFDDGTTAVYAEGAQVPLA